MQFPRRGQPAPLGVLYDSSLDGGIDQVLALAMLFGFAALQQVRIPSLTHEPFQPAERGVSRCGRPILRADLAGDFVPNKIPLPIGMASTGKPVDSVPPMVSAPLAKLGADGKPGLSPRHGEAERHGRSDRADAQRADGAGRSERRRDSRRPPRRICCRCMALPGGKDWAAKKARVLSIAGGRFEGSARRSGHPSRCCRLPEAARRMARADRDGGRGAERGAAVSGETLNAIAAWAPNHPVVDAYRALKPMP